MHVSICTAGFQLQERGVQKTEPAGQCSNGSTPPSSRAPARTRAVGSAGHPTAPCAVLRNPLLRLYCASRGAGYAFRHMGSTVLPIHGNQVGTRWSNRRGLVKPALSEEPLGRRLARRRTRDDAARRPDYLLTSGERVAHPAVCPIGEKRRRTEETRRRMGDVQNEATCERRSEDRQTHR